MPLPKIYLVTNGPCIAQYVLKKEVIESGEFFDTTMELDTRLLSPRETPHYYETLHKHYDIVYNNRAKEPQQLEEDTFIAAQIATSEKQLEVLLSGDDVE